MSASNQSPKADYDKFNIDFTELADAEPREGYGFQSLIAEIGRELDYEVERGGTGPDHGRDLFFVITYDGPYGKSFKLKWLVTCKDNSKSQQSVSRGDLATVYSDANAFHCDGILLACATHPTDDLVTHLRELEKNMKCPILTHIWTGADIKKLLYEREDNLRLLLVRHFPKSYGYSSKATKRITDELLDVLRGLDGEQLVVRVEKLSADNVDTMLLFELATLVLEKITDIERLYPLLRLWASNTNKDFRTAIDSLLDQFLEKNFEEMLTERAAEYVEERLRRTRAGITFMRVYEAFLELDDESISIDCRFETEFEHEYEDEDLGRTKTKTSYGSGQVIIVVSEEQMYLSDFHISSKAFK